MHKEIERLLPGECPPEWFANFLLGGLVALPPIVREKHKALGSIRAVDARAQVLDALLDAVTKRYEFAGLHREKYFNDGLAAERARETNEVLVQMIRAQPRIRAIEFPQRIEVGIDPMGLEESVVLRVVDALDAWALLGTPPMLGRRGGVMLDIHPREYALEHVRIEAKSPHIGNTAIDWMPCCPHLTNVKHSARFSAGDTHGDAACTEVVCKGLKCCSGVCSSVVDVLLVVTFLVPLCIQLLSKQSEVGLTKVEARLHSEGCRALGIDAVHTRYTESGLLHIEHRKTLRKDG